MPAKFLMTEILTNFASTTRLDKQKLLQVYELMRIAEHMSILYEEHKAITSKYVHATARGHEAIQIALGLLLQQQDYVAPYYRDDALLLAMGLRPYELMLQLFAKREDPFSGGRTYYSHPSLCRDDMPKIPHQSSATGMQAIPITGVAQGIQYLESQGLYRHEEKIPALSVCSIGDGAMTEGEVSEALQMTALHQYPILYLVQDNGWGISARADEMYAQDASVFAQGFEGIEVRTIDGTDFFECWQTLQEVLNLIRLERRPFLVHARTVLLNHHTSGVRQEWYRTDLESHQHRDPITKFHKELLLQGIPEAQLIEITTRARNTVEAEMKQAQEADDPLADDLYLHDFVSTPIVDETGERKPQEGKEVVMVDAALHAIDKILEDHPEALLYGQDVGGDLGGVFREAALLAKKYGDKRVFNTPIQEAYIIGSTVGMSAVGCKPIVEVLICRLYLARSESVVC